MSDIKFECSHCKQHLACEEQDAGKQIQCPACNQLIQIPEVSAAIVPPAGPSRLHIAHQAPKAPRETAPLPPEESLEPEPRRPRSWRWAWRLGAYAVLAAVLVIAWPKLTKLRELPKEASNVSKLSVQTLTVQFAMIDSTTMTSGESSEAKAKFIAALKENYGHENYTACSSPQAFDQWVGQWPIGTGYKLAYNPDKAEVTIWCRIEGRPTIVKNYLDAKADKLTDILKQAKEGIQILSKMGS